MAKTKKAILGEEIDSKRSAKLREMAAQIMKGSMTSSGNIVTEITSEELHELSAKPHPDNYDDEEYAEDNYITQSHTEEISFIELAIFNDFLHEAYLGRTHGVKVTGYGEVDNIGRLSFGGVFDITNSYWFNSLIDGDDNEFIIQTMMFKNNHNELITQLTLTCKTGIVLTSIENIYKNIRKIAFNNSKYKGKCIKVKLREGNFRGIEIIDMKVGSTELILNDIQKKYIDHFVTRVGRGGNARYLLNGEPGTGKTESIRDIIRRLMPMVTFIIPDFSTSDDLTSIMEACEIFDSAVIIMDDIDLYLGSRDNGSYTRLLGQFLAFFDGVKKRKISLLASTNDKGLVDKAAERPGRFNLTIDYTFLDERQIELVCNIHLPVKWRIQEVYDIFSSRIDGKKAKVTGAFIGNLSENLIEMSEDDDKWGLEDTISLITETYRGFYSSQVEKENNRMSLVQK